MGRSVREGLAPLGVGWDTMDLEGLRSSPYRSDHLAIVAHPAHPIARLPSCEFAQTPDYDHVGLPTSTAVHTMLGRAAALAGRSISYRAVVSTFDASLRCVRAGLGIAVVPREVVEPSLLERSFSVVPLTDAWAHRRFVVCHRDEASLSPSARLLLRHLEKSGTMSAGTGVPAPGAAPGGGAAAVSPRPPAAR